MTPAIKLLQRQKISFRIHEYPHDATAESYGLEAAEKLALPVEQVFKTLIVTLDDGSLAVAILSVGRQLDLKAVARCCQRKKAVMCDKARAEKTTGYVLGGISPLGQKKALRTLIDSQASQQSSLFVSAGRRGLEVELAPADLLALTRGELADIAVR